MVTMEQHQRLFKARIALALYAEYGKVPKAVEVIRAYDSFKTQHPSIFTAYIQSHEPQRQQLTLFSLSPSIRYLAEHHKTRSFVSLS